MELCNTAAIRPIVFLLQQVPTFISRGATHHRDARDFYQRRWELLLMNFASKFVIYGNLLGSFTCRKAGTWDILFYFPSEGRHTEDFPDTRKIQRLRSGLNPRTRVPVASMLTTRPPKSSTQSLAYVLLFNCWLEQRHYFIWQLPVRLAYNAMDSSLSHNTRLIDQKDNISCRFFINTDECRNTSDPCGRGV